MLSATVMTAGEVQNRMRGLPFASFGQMAPGTSLILAPHPDDESLGCGGLIAMASAGGCPPIIVCVTDGAGSHPNSRTYPPLRLRVTREAELHDAAAILGTGAERVHFLRLRDTRAPRCGPDFDAAVAVISALICRHDISTIFTSWRFDPHCDHEATAVLGTAVANACDVRLAFYPVWGWLLPPEEVLPIVAIEGQRLDITAVLPRKRRAIAAHRSQYSDLVTDDPSGFRLPHELFAVAEQSFEVFLAP